MQRHTTPPACCSCTCRQTATATINNVTISNDWAARHLHQHGYNGSGGDATTLTVTNSVITGTAGNGIDTASATMPIQVGVTNTTFSNIGGASMA